MSPTAARTAARSTVRYGVAGRALQVARRPARRRRGAWAYAIATQTWLPASALRQHRGRRRRCGFAARQDGHQGRKGGTRPAPWSTARRSTRAREPTRTCFANAKAQAWWALRDRFLETFKASERRSLRSRRHHQPEPGDRGAARAQERAVAGDLSATTPAGKVR